MDDDVVIDLRALEPVLDLTDARPTFEIVLRETSGRETGVADALLDQMIAAAVSNAVHDAMAGSGRVS